MPSSLLLLLLLSQCWQQSLAAASAGNEAKQCSSVGEVITLNRENVFNLVQPRKDKWLLYFHAPWCAKCKELGPVLDSVAQQGAGKFFVGSVDCGDDVWIRTMFGIRAYPSFKVAHKEAMFPYPQKGVLDDEYLFEFADETFVKHLNRAERFPEA